ncbi:MAG: tagaturonate reductase [Clostridia bacterium]|nr:tagaturonate reductase [Clostridia bacterium]
MIKILHYGEGNFLRTFVDAYFDCLNSENVGEYGVYIVKPISFGSLDKFRRQNNKYHIVLRGIRGDGAVEDVYAINCVKDAIDPFVDHDKYISLAGDEDLKIIVSNTTEAGICYNGADKFGDFEGVTYPAKLTQFLYARYKAGLKGVYLMPVELIDDNADNLKACVKKYIDLWGLPADFAKWNDEQNFYCNTLVDRIVSGYPKDDDTRAHLEKLIGEKDELVSIGEPFGLWAVENKGNIGKYIKDGKHNIEVVLTDDIKYYKKRKVRVLNGSHTNLVPVGLLLGKQTVYDCMTDEKLSSFVTETLNEEIIPFVSDDTQATAAFAESVKKRFLNPFLNHQLTSIALNSISKWRARDLPSFNDYYVKNGVIAPHLTVGFSYLIALYTLAERRDGKYYANVGAREIQLIDDEKYLSYFAKKKDLKEFMKDESVWGQDLTEFAGFYEKVSENVSKILNKECLI